MEVVIKLGEFLWRPLTDSDEDTDFVLALRNSPESQAAFYTRTITREQHRAFLQRPQAEDDIDWIVQKNGTRIGQFGIFDIDRKNRKAEAGRIVLASPEFFVPALFVNGYVVFELLKLNKVCAEVLAGNTVIWRAIERFGCVREGVLREHSVLGGKPTDVHVYGTLASDWKKLKPGLVAQYGEPQVIRSTV